MVRCKVGEVSGFVVVDMEDNPPLLAVIFAASFTPIRGHLPEKWEWQQEVAVSVEAVEMIGLLILVISD